MKVIYGLLLPFLYFGCVTGPTEPAATPIHIIPDTTFVDISLDKPVVYFRISFTVADAPYCKVYVNGEYNSLIKYNGARMFLIENGSLIRITYPLGSDTLERYCIARDSCVWRVD